jgi:membrane protease YdiL (CAAX protease family)
VPNPKFILYIFLAFFPIAFVSRILTPRFDIWYSDYFHISSFTYFISFTILYLPLGILVEELAERALLQSRVSELFGRKAAIFVVTLNFVAYHASLLTPAKLDYQIIMLFTWLAYSFLLSIVFEYSLSIYPVLLLHFTIDLVSALQIFLHMNSIVMYETILWSLWATFFILNLKDIIDLISEKIKALPKIKIPLKYQFYLFFLSLPYPLLLLLNDKISQWCVLPLILLGFIILSYMRRSLELFVRSG